MATKRITTLPVEVPLVYVAVPIIAEPGDHLLVWNGVCQGVYTGKVETTDTPRLPAPPKRLPAPPKEASKPVTKEKKQHSSSAEHRSQAKDRQAKTLQALNAHFTDGMTYEDLERVTKARRKDTYNDVYRMAQKGIVSITLTQVGNKTEARVWRKKVSSA